MPCRINFVGANPATVHCSFADACAASTSRQRQKICCFLWRFLELVVDSSKCSGSYERIAVVGDWAGRDAGTAFDAVFKAGEMLDTFRSARGFYFFRWP